MAWQFDRPDLGIGIVQAFRRSESPYESAHFQLATLDPQAHYRVRNLDSGRATQRSGSELMEQGLTITLKKQPDSATILYERIPPRETTKEQD